MEYVASPSAPPFGGCFSSPIARVTLPARPWKPTGWIFLELNLHLRRGVASSPIHNFQGEPNRAAKVAGFPGRGVVSSRTFRFGPRAFVATCSGRSWRGRSTVYCTQIIRRGHGLRALRGQVRTLV
jgi:hypothetical protein